MVELSIIMSVYNGEAHLKEAIDSILNQSFKDFEFLITDDKSTDSSLKIIEKYAKKDRRIRVIRNKMNIGLTKSLNRSLKLVKGTFIGRQDADDISAKDRFEKELRFIAGMKNVWVVGSDINYINSKGKIVGENNLSKNNQLIARKKLPTQIACHPSVLFRKKQIIDLGGYDEQFRFAQDLELWLKVITHGGKIVSLPEKLYYLRRGNKGSASTAHSRKQAYCALQIRLKYLKHFMISPKYWKNILLMILIIITPTSLKRLLK